MTGRGDGTWRCYQLSFGQSSGVPLLERCGPGETYENYRYKYLCVYVFRGGVVSHCGYLAGEKSMK